MKNLSNQALINLFKECNLIYNSEAPVKEKMTSDLKELVKSSFGHFKMDKITNTYSDLKSEILFRIKTNKMTLV